MPRGRPATGREEYMRIKLHKDTHLLWIERKKELQLKSDNELALYFLNLPNVFSSAVRDTQRPECEAMPVVQSIKLLRDQTIFEVREDGQSTESLYEARKEGSPHLSAGNSTEKFSTTLTRYLLAKKV